MGGVIIGTGPHKASVTIEVRGEREILRVIGRFPMIQGCYRQLLRYVRPWLPEYVAKSRRRRRWSRTDSRSTAAASWCRTHGPSIARRR